MIGLALLSYSMDEIMNMYGGIFCQIQWEVMSNLIFLGSSRNSDCSKLPNGFEGMGGGGGGI